MTRLNHVGLWVVAYRFENISLDVCWSTSFSRFYRACLFSFILVLCYLPWRRRAWTVVRL